MGAEELVLYLTPFVVWAVTAAIKKWILPNVSGFVITSFIVPALSAVATWIASQVVPELSWLQNFLLGFGGVFVHEFIKQLQQAVGLGK